MATEPLGEDQSLKKTAPVTAEPIGPRPVRVEEEPWVIQLEGEVELVVTLAGARGSEMYCHRSQAWLGFWNTWSCSKGWSGTWGGR